VNSSRRSFLAASLAFPAAGLVADAAPKEAAGGLSYRTLGRTGLKVTSVAFGCMITSDASVVERAADLGINYFDTARGYQGGNNERMVGAALKPKRNQLYISTKSHARTRAAALAELDTSLQALGTDYVDIWYLHAVGSGDEITDELLEAQQSAKKAGKIRFAGVSTHGGQPSVIDAAVRSGKIDVVLLGYNFTMGQEIEAAIDKAEQAGIGLVAMKVMTGGARRGRRGGSVPEALTREGAMLAALKWVLKNPKIDTTIPGITDMDQLDENMKAMSVKFSDTDAKTLAAHLERIGPEYCRMCGACSGTCAKGLPVADVLRFVTYADGYGQFSLGRERFLELPQELRSVRCGDCASCTVKCVNGVRVTERLSLAQEMFA
jgi:aryl-alcohol dehydrogenase-like predicted oxidoreductase